MISVVVDCALWFFMVILNYNLGHCCQSTKNAFIETDPCGIITSYIKAKEEEKDLKFKNNKNNYIKTTFLTKCEQNIFKLFQKENCEKQHQTIKRKRLSRSENNDVGDAMEIGDSIKNKKKTKNDRGKSSELQQPTQSSSGKGVASGCTSSGSSSYNSGDTISSNVNKFWRSENNKISSYQATFVVTNSNCTNKTTPTNDLSTIKTNNNFKINVKHTSATSTNSTAASSNRNRKRKAEINKKIPTFSWRLQLPLNFSEQEFAKFLQRYIIDLNLLRSYGYPVISTVHKGCVEFTKSLPKLNKTPSLMKQHLTKYQLTNSHQQHHQHQHIQHLTTHTKLINNNNNKNDNVIEKHEKKKKKKSTKAFFNNDVQDDDDDDDDDISETSSNDSGHGSSETNSIVDEPKSIIINNNNNNNDINDINDVTMSKTNDNEFQLTYHKYNHTQERQCVRCHCIFEVNEIGEYLKRESCTFHWGKLYELYKNDANKIPKCQYTCCKGDCYSQGCVQNEMHVWTGAVDGLNGPFTDFVLTKTRNNKHNKSKKNMSIKVFALDCEMSFTKRGLEVTKITLIAHDGGIVYEHFVRPDTEIIDYNTRFSGITEKDLSPVSKNSIKSLNEVQNELLEIIDAETILIGHGLDNDLRALRILHTTIVDTSIVFPHANGFPFRRGLKHLAKVYLRRDIQNGESGHSCYEDSRASLDLMLWKMHKEWRYH